MRGLAGRSAGLAFVSLVLAVAAVAVMVGWLL